jgi:hypothetical protein
MDESMYRSYSCFASGSTVKDAEALSRDVKDSSWLPPRISFSLPEWVDTVRFDTEEVETVFSSWLQLSAVNFLISLSSEKMRGPGDDVDGTLFSSWLHCVLNDANSLPRECVRSPGIVSDDTMFRALLLLSVMNFASSLSRAKGSAHGDVLLDGLSFSCSRGV